jgi:signal transduction histidine kinase
LSSGSLLLRLCRPQSKIVAAGRVAATARERDMKPPRRSQKSHPAKPTKHRLFSGSELEQQRAAVSEVLRVIAGSPHDLQPIFDIIVHSATRLCHATFGNLRLAEAQGFRLVAEVSYPSSLAERWRQPPFNIRHGPLARMVEKKSPLHIPDLAAERDYLKLQGITDLVKFGRIRTLLIVPMLSNDAVIGAITVSRTRVQPFTKKEIEMVADFAAQATIALEVTRKERELRELQTALAHVHRVTTMGQLVASIAHEIKQPLAALMMNGHASLRWLDKDPPDFEEMKKNIEGMIKNGNRAAAVMERIHGLVKKSAPRRDKLDINDAIREVISFTRSEATKDSVVIKTQFKEAIAHVRGDRVQLQQVLLNLIVNAIEAMKNVGEGNRELDISTTKAANSEQLMVAVGDTGPGLSAESLNRIFEPFYTTKSHGMGMGLSICRYIIEDHGGRLWATGRDGPGAVFQFTIPIEPAD